MLPKSIENRVLTFVKSIEGMEHIPQKGGGIIAANHNNHLDAFILTAVFQKHFNRTINFLSRKDIILWSIIGQWGADRLSAILIDPKKRGESLDIALDALEKGNIIGIYPEAQLNDKSYLLKPRSGIARLALWTGFPIVPVGISEGPGAHRGFKLLHDILFHFKNSSVIKFGKPLQFDKFNEKFIPKELLEQTSDQIMKAIAPLCAKSYDSY